MLKWETFPSDAPVSWMTMLSTDPASRRNLHDCMGIEPATSGVPDQCSTTEQQDTSMKTC
jgi:hypothetical protein